MKGSDITLCIIEYLSVVICMVFVAVMLGGGGVVVENIMRVLR